MDSNDSGIVKSRRSRSPYHKKCIPPFVDSSQIDKHLVSKLDRSELEDRYIVLTDENLSLKRLLNEHQKKIQRLCTQLQRQVVIDKKEGRNTVDVWNENQITLLHQQNRVLQAKVNVLTQQLQSHSRMHARAHGSNILKGKCTPVSSPDHRDEHAILEKYAVKSLPATTGEDMKRFQYLQQDFGIDNEEIDAHIADLEREYAECGVLNENCSSSELEKVMDNVEMIRLRRFNKRQAAHIAALSDHLESAKNELQKMRKTVDKVNEESEHLTKQLQRERQKLREIQGSAVHSSTQAQAIKDLEEQVRDLQNEKKSLKEYNQKLLELTQKNVSDEGAKNKMQPEISQDTSFKMNLNEVQELKEKTITLQNKLDESLKNNTLMGEKNLKLLDEYEKETTKLKEEKYELEQKLQDALSEIEALKNNKVSTSEAANSSKQQTQILEERKLEEQLNNSVVEIEGLRKQLALREYHEGNKVNHLREELLKQTRECEELKNNLECTVLQLDNLRVQANNAIAEYREKVLELEKENKGLYEKLNEAQNKMEIVEKQLPDVEAVNKHKDELLTRIRDNEELQHALQTALRQIEDLKKQLIVKEQTTAEYGEKVHELERENKGLSEKLNEAQNKIDRLEKLPIDGEVVNDEYREKAIELKRENKELREKLNEAQNKVESLGKQFPNVKVVNTEYREKVLELETENKGLKEKINEAQNKKENLEKQFSGVEVVNYGEIGEKVFNESHHEYTVVQESNQHAENEIEDLREYEDTDNNAARRETYASKIELNENRRGDSSTDDVALVVILLKEMNTELERCYSIISCQYEINKLLLVTIESFSVESGSFSRVSETMHSKISEEKSANHTACEIKEIIEKEELSLSKKLFIAELKPLGLLEKHLSLISQQMQKIQFICQVIKPVMLQAIQVIQGPKKIQYGLCKGKENDEHKCESALIEPTTLGPTVPESIAGMCRFEIYMTKLTFDRNSYNYLESIRKNPKVNLAWHFLDLHTCTSFRKASKACFESSTVYCGPLTKEVTECLEQSPVNVVCNVIDNYDQSIGIAKGRVDVIEAFKNPGSIIKNRIMITGDHVCGELFCWFCLHCAGENQKSQYSISRQQKEVQEVCEDCTCEESGYTGDRICNPTCDWKLTNDDMNTLINICHCNEICEKER